MGNVANNSIVLIGILHKEELVLPVRFFVFNLLT